MGQAICRSRQPVFGVRMRCGRRNSSILWVQARPRLNLTSLIAVHTLRITVIDLREGGLTKGTHDAPTPNTSAYSRARRRHIDPVVPGPIIDSRRRVPNCDRRPRTAGQEIVT